MTFIKKTIKNIIWFMFMLTVFALFFVLAHETGNLIFGYLAGMTFVLMTGIYRPVIRLSKDICKQFDN